MISEVRLSEQQLARLLQAMNKLTDAIERNTAARAGRGPAAVHEGEKGPDVPTPRRFRDR